MKALRASSPFRNSPYTSMDDSSPLVRNRNPLPPRSESIPSPPSELVTRNGTHLLLPSATVLLLVCVNFALPPWSLARCPRGRQLLPLHQPNTHTNTRTYTDRPAHTLSVVLEKDSLLLASPRTILHLFSAATIISRPQHRSASCGVPLSAASDRCFRKARRRRSSQFSRHLESVFLSTVENSVWFLARANLFCRDCCDENDGDEKSEF